MALKMQFLNQQAGKILDEPENKHFHNKVRKALFLLKRARLDILTTVRFLYTRLKTDRDKLDLLWDT
jgi:hypothetical protein